jgi:hypothetical protein
VEAEFGLLGRMRGGASLIELVPVYACVDREEKVARVAVYVVRLTVGQLTLPRNHIDEGSEGMKEELGEDNATLRMAE